MIITVVGRPRGFGRASALRFAQEGANLVLADLGADNGRVGEIDGISPDLEAVAEEVKSVGAHAIAVATDVSIEADVDKLVAAAVDRFGRVDAMLPMPLSLLLKATHWRCHMKPICEVCR